MKTARQTLGKWGEDQAADFLMKRGYSIMGRNVRTPYGEIDLVARHMTANGEVIVFVEVKTRRSTAFGYPEEAVTRQKKEHLLSSAQAYLMEHPELAGDWRIDVIAIQQKQSGAAPAITYFENAVS